MPFTEEYKQELIAELRSGVSPEKIAEREEVGVDEIRALLSPQDLRMINLLASYGGIPPPPPPPDLLLNATLAGNVAEVKRIMEGNPDTKKALEHVKHWLESYRTSTDPTKIQLHDRMRKILFFLKKSYNPEKTLQLRTLFSSRELVPESKIVQLLQEGANPDDIPLENLHTQTFNRLSILDVMIQHGYIIPDGLLVYAIETNNPEELEYVLKHGVSPDEVFDDSDGNKTTGLLYCMDLLEDDDMSKLVEILLQYGANPNIDVNYRYPLDVMLFHVYETFVEANVFEYESLIILMLEKDANPVLHLTTGVISKETLLFWATRFGNKGVDFARFMLTKYGTIDLNIPDKNGYTPLYNACESGANEMVRLLLEFRAVPNILTRGMTPLMAAAMEGHIEVVKELLKDDRVDQTKKNASGKTAYDLASRADIKILLKPANLVDDGKKYAGFTKSDVALFNNMFDKPSDISICPVCLNYAERSEGCMFMKHTCADPHPELYALYNYLGTIEWCTICGRVCNQHRHYKYALPTAVELPAIAPWPEEAVMMAQYYGDEKECVQLGGGGISEKIRRIHRMLAYACELQDEVGKITDKDARRELIEETWKAADSRNRRTSAILEKKDFGFPCIFPDADTSAPTPVAEQTYPDIRRPADEAELVPIRHDHSPCAIVEHEDERPVWQFQHKQPNGTIYRHEREFICGPDLETSLRANPLDGRCFNAFSCKGILYPEEIKDIVSPKFYEVYRTNFNRARAPQAGRGRRRIVRGGAGPSLMRPLDPHTTLCASAPSHKISQSKSITKMEGGYSSAINGSAGNSAPVDGGRRRRARRSTKKALRLARRLKKVGGEVAEAVQEVKEAVASPEGGRRHHKKHRKTHRRRSLFGLKY